MFSSAGNAALPMMGQVDATVTAVTETLIHGDRYLDLAIDTGRGRVAVRVSRSACDRPPSVGSRVRLHVLLGQVDRLETLG
jgi:hypothetical protein